jgi:hypothetical protein
MQRMEGQAMFYNNYLFYIQPIGFFRRFRVTKEFFMIVYNVKEYDNYFVLKKDCTEMHDFSSITKCSASMRMLHMKLLKTQNISTYACLSSQPLNKYTYSSWEWWENLDHTIWESQMKKRQLVSWHIIQWEHFLGCSKASIACSSHGKKLFAWQGLYKGHHSLILEVVVDYDLWVWHAFFWACRNSQWDQIAATLFDVW